MSGVSENNDVAMLNRCYFSYCVAHPVDVTKGLLELDYRHLIEEVVQDDLAAGRIPYTT